MSRPTEARSRRALIRRLAVCRVALRLPSRLDAVFDSPDDVPEDVRENKRYAGLTGYTIEEVAKAVEADYGKIDILVHSLAKSSYLGRSVL